MKFTEFLKEGVTFSTPSYQIKNALNSVNGLISEVGEIISALDRSEKTGKQLLPKMETWIANLKKYPKPTSRHEALNYKQLTEYTENNMKDYVKMLPQIQKESDKLETQLKQMQKLLKGAK